MKVMKTILLVACLVALSVLVSANVDPLGVGWCQNVGERCRHTGNMKCCNNLECENQFCRRRGGNNGNNGRCRRLNQECEEFGRVRCCDQLRCRRRGGIGGRRTCQLY